MNIYLAGPMRGIPEFNYPAFAYAAARLREGGHTVFSPAEKDLERDAGLSVEGTRGDLAELEVQGFNIRDAIMDDLTYIAREADAIALLPGWEGSKGVRVELALAKFLELEVIDLASAPKSKQSKVDLQRIIL